jgi:hypothetical protein
LGCLPESLLERPHDSGSIVAFCGRLVLLVGSDEFDLVDETTPEQVLRMVAPTGFEPVLPPVEPAGVPDAAWGCDLE